MDEWYILTLHQPWATAVSLGLKRIETRSWKTNKRGKLIIHAGKKWDDEQVKFWRMSHRRVDAWYRGGKFGINEVQAMNYSERPLLGCALCVVDLAACHFVGQNMITESIPEIERLFGDFSIGRYLWILEGVHTLHEPISYRGGRLLRKADERLLEAVWDQLPELRPLR